LVGALQAGVFFDRTIAVQKVVNTICIKFWKHILLQNKEPPKSIKITDQICIDR
jgi:hypothetical protein